MAQDTLDTVRPTSRPLRDAGDPAAREAAIEALVTKWTAHMRWRKNYDRWREDRLWQEETQMPRLRAIARAAGETRGRQVLDIGSGMGGFLVAAARHEMRPVGIEPNADYCTIARLRGMRYGLEPHVIQSVGEALPFPDASFDVVLAQDILEHVQDHDATLREIRRVLRPDGVALVTVINRFAWRDPHYHLRAINYLPRAAADRLIEALGRSKRRAAFADNQRLSAMYYDTFRGFAARAASRGFATSDPREAALASAGDRDSTRHERAVNLLSRLHLAVPAYRLHRAVAASAFEVTLRPLAPPR